MYINLDSPPFKILSVGFLVLDKKLCYLLRLIDVRTSVVRGWACVSLSIILAVIQSSTYSFRVVFRSDSIYLVVVP